MKISTQRLDRHGFTLIELLVVIGILGILLAITLVAINPSQQFQQAGNAQRQSDVKQILNALNQYMTANKGQYPAAVTVTAQNIGSGAGKSDLCSALAPTFIADLPQDPTNGTRTPASGLCTAATAYDTGYTVKVSASGNRITVAAPSAQNGATIAVTR